MFDAFCLAAAGMAQHGISLRPKWSKPRISVAHALCTADDAHKCGVEVKLTDILGSHSDFHAIGVTWQLGRNIWVTRDTAPSGPHQPLRHARPILLAFSVIHKERCGSWYVFELRSCALCLVLCKVCTTAGFCCAEVKEDGEHTHTHTHTHMLKGDADCLAAVCGAYPLVTPIAAADIRHVGLRKRQCSSIDVHSENGCKSALPHAVF
jgi:hypothetical protein